MTGNRPRQPPPENTHSSPNARSRRWQADVDAAGRVRRQLDDHHGQQPPADERRFVLHGHARHEQGDQERQHDRRQHSPHRRGQNESGLCARSVAPRHRCDRRDVLLIAGQGGSAAASLPPAPPPPRAAPGSHQFPVRPPDSRAFPAPNACRLLATDRLGSRPQHTAVARETRPGITEADRPCQCPNSCARVSGVLRTRACARATWTTWPDELAELAVRVMSRFVACAVHVYRPRDPRCCGSAGT
jgi:hypothetical protein